MNLPEHLTISALAALVGRKPQTIRLHIREGRLVASKFRGAHGWRVRAKDARKWAERYLGINLDSESSS